MLTTNEKWIRGYEGLYSVDTDGNIWSYHTVYNKKEKRNLKLHIRDYITVSLRKDGKDKRYRVHRLVAEHFIPNPDNLPQVNHKDGNKYNNNINNLEWISQSDNAKHAFANGLQLPSKPNCKSVSQYDLCGNFVAVFKSIGDAQMITGICKQSISMCINGKRKSAGGFMWEVN